MAAPRFAGFEAWAFLQPGAAHPPA